ncbi:MAG: fliR [Enterovirga sp.]|jgi:flagellar biosynthetic protein FliR|nr:fliR [Enterovirga sp.]
MTFAIPDLASLFALAFARIGTLVMLFPGVGERLVPARLRLAFAVLLTLVLLPAVGGLLPAGREPQGVIGALLGEVAIGLVLGIATRMVVATLQIAGAIVAQELGLSFAMTVDPTQGSGQEAAIGNFLTLLGVTLVFAADVHHLAIMAIRDSYALLPPVGMPDPGDAARLAVSSVGRSFTLALQLAAPFIAFALLFNLGLGILSRLMPQMQVFFLAMPLTIMLGVLILMTALGVMMTLYVGQLGGFLQTLGAR